MGDEDGMDVVGRLRDAGDDEAADEGGRRQGVDRQRHGDRHERPRPEDDDGPPVACLRARGWWVRRCFYAFRFIHLERGC